MQVEPPVWNDSFAPWHDWLHRRARTCRHLLRAAQQQATYRLRFLFTFWRFVLARNRTLRTAWHAAVQHQELLMKWSTLIAFRTFVRFARRERKTRRLVLRHWSAAVRENQHHRQLTFSQLLVRALLPP